MQSRIYTNRSNTIRAARAALGANAILAVDFKIETVDGGFVWTPLKPEGVKLAALLADPKAPANAAARKRAQKDKKNKKARQKRAREKKPPKPLYLQPKMLNLIKAIHAAPGEGATVQYLSHKLGIQPHSVRGAIAHLRAAHVAISVGKYFRQTHYHIKRMPAELQRVMEGTEGEQ